MRIDVEDLQDEEFDRNVAGVGGEDGQSEITEVILLQSCLPFRFWRKKYDFRVNLSHSSDYTILPPNLPFFSGPLQKFLPNTILGI